MKILSVSVRNNYWKVGRDQYGATGPFAYAGDQWVSFEDPVSAKEKVSSYWKQSFN